MAAACLLIAAGAFVWLHSGGRADAACEEARFVHADGFSAWPPGARCTYGLPPRTEVVLNDRFILIAVALTILLVVSIALTRPRPASPGPRSADRLRR